MVSQPRTPPDTSSRGRLLAAAAAEFAARGFDGAKVDRITRRARVNKAMLYYHFTNKAALYRAILGDLFGTLATAVHNGRTVDRTPEDQLRAFIATIAAETGARPHFPAIWLREMAEGGRHVDASVAKSIAVVLSVLVQILEDGKARGVFRDAHPLVTQMGIVAPLLLFSVSAPVRDRFKGLAPPGSATVSRDAVIAHVETATLAALKMFSGTSDLGPRTSDRTSPPDPGPRTSNHSHPSRRRPRS